MASKFTTEHLQFKNVLGDAPPPQKRGKPHLILSPFGLYISLPVIKFHRRLVIFALPIYQLLVNPLSGHGPATAIVSVPRGLYVKPTFEHIFKHASIKVPSNTVVVTLQFSYKYSYIHYVMVVLYVLLSSIDIIHEKWARFLFSLDKPWVKDNLAIFSEAVKTKSSLDRFIGFIDGSIGRLRFHYDNDNEYENDFFVC